MLLRSQPQQHWPNNYELVLKMILTVPTHPASSTKAKDGKEQGWRKPTASFRERMSRTGVAMGAVPHAHERSNERAPRHHMGGDRPPEDSSRVKWLKRLCFEQNRDNIRKKKKVTKFQQARNRCKAMPTRRVQDYMHFLIVPVVRRWVVRNSF